MSNSELEMLWKMFVDEVILDAGVQPPLVNFLGSVIKHKTCFTRAVFKFNQVQAEKSV